MKAHELMHKRTQCLSATTPVTAIARKMQEDGIGAVVVVENGQLVGMVTDRDVTCRAIAGGRDLTGVIARDVMTEGLVCCQEAELAEEALRLMESKHVHRLAVVDENRNMVGMLRLEDVSAATKGNGAIPAMNHGGLGAITALNGRLHDSVVTLNTEWIGFMNQRLKEHVAMTQRLAQCKTIEDAWSVYGTFWQKAGEQYLKALQRLATIGSCLVVVEPPGPPQTKGELAAP